MLRIHRIALRNYRCFVDEEIFLARRALFIGANNSGKSSLLEAVDKVFGAGRRAYGFDEDDLPRGCPTDSRLEVEVEIRPWQGQCFSEDEHALFETHVDFAADGTELVTVRAQAGFDADGLFRSQARFVKVDGEDDGPVDRTVRERLSFFYLPALRDVRRELDDRAGLWSRLTGLLQQAHDPTRLAEVAAEAGRSLAEAVLGASRLEELGDRVREYVGRILYGTEAAIEAELRSTPLDYRAVLRRTSLMVSTPGDQVPTPIDRQSTGIQTLALFGLFRAYLETQGGMILAIGLEEPESHLSPHSARSLVRLVSQGDTQVLLTTHSPVIADRLDPADTVLLRRRGGRSQAKFTPPGTFTAVDRLHIMRVIRAGSSEFLFGRAVLFVEGQTEEGALPEFAGQLGIELDRLAVSIVGVGGSTFRPFLRLVGPDCLDIPHAVVCDNDLAVSTLLRVLGDLGRLPSGLDFKNPDAALLEPEGVFWWPERDLESYLVTEGGYAAFEAAANGLYGEGVLSRFRQRRTEEGQPDDEVSTIRAFVAVRRVRKPELASEAARRYPELGIVIPAQVERVLRYLASLAERELAAAAAGMDEQHGDPPSQP